MSIMSSLNTGVAGLDAQSRGIGHISDNLANAQTTGYKQVDTRFEEIVTASSNESHTPGAVDANPAFRNDLQGDITDSDVSTHMSLSGSGMFNVARAERVEQTDVTFEEQDYYTRRGDFEVDRQGFLVNGSDHYLQGRRVLDQESRETADEITEVNVAQGGLGLEPQQTTEVAYNGNVPAGTDQANPSDFFTTDTEGRAQRSRVTLDAAGRIEEGDRYEVTIDDRTFAYEASGGESVPEIRGYFVDAINSGVADNPPGKMILPDDPANHPAQGGPGGDFPPVRAEIQPDEPGTFTLESTDEAGGTEPNEGASFSLEVRESSDPVGAVTEAKTNAVTQATDPANFDPMNADFGYGGGNNEGLANSVQLEGTESFSVTVGANTITYRPDEDETVEDVFDFLKQGINGVDPVAGGQADGQIIGVGQIEGVSAQLETVRADNGTTGANADFSQLVLSSTEAGQEIPDMTIDVRTDDGSEVQVGESRDSRRVDLSTQVGNIAEGDVFTLELNGQSVSVEATSDTNSTTDLADALEFAATNVNTTDGFEGPGTVPGDFNAYLPQNTGEELAGRINDGGTLGDMIQTDGGSELRLGVGAGDANRTLGANASPPEGDVVDDFSARLTGPNGSIDFPRVNDNRQGEAVFANSAELREAVPVGAPATQELSNIGQLDINTAIRVGDGFTSGEDFNAREEYYTTEDNFIDNTVSGGSTTIYDEGGNAQEIQFRWMYRGEDSQTGEEVWQMYYKDPNVQNQGGINATMGNANGEEHWVPALGFEGARFQNGELTSQPNFTGNEAITFTQGEESQEVAEFTFENPDGSSGLTNFADDDSTITRLEQNGFTAGSVEEIEVDDSGYVVSNFDNGEERALYEVTVSLFSDTNALSRQGGGAFQSTRQSGEPRIESQGRNGAGDIQGSTLEASTVEMSEQFTKMIETQRIYSANTRVITTTDEMLQETLQLK